MKFVKLRFALVSPIDQLVPSLSPTIFSDDKDNSVM